MSRKSKLRQAERAARLARIAVRCSDQASQDPIRGTAPEADEPIVWKLFRDIVLPLLRGGSQGATGPLFPLRCRRCTPAERAWIVANMHFLVLLAQDISLVGAQQDRVQRVFRQLYGPELSVFKGQQDNEILAFHPSAEWRRHSRGETRLTGDYRERQARTSRGFQGATDEAILDEIMCRWCRWNESRRPVILQETCQRYKKSNLSL